MFYVCCPTTINLVAQHRGEYHSPFSILLLSVTVKNKKRGEGYIKTKETTS